MEMVKRAIPLYISKFEKKKFEFEKKKKNRLSYIFSF